MKQQNLADKLKKVLIRLNNSTTEERNLPNLKETTNLKYQLKKIRVLVKYQNI